MTSLWPWLLTRFRAVHRCAGILDRFDDERGQVEAIVIALAVFILILLISDRRIVVQ